MRKRIRRAFPIRRIYLRAVNAAHARDVVQHLPERTTLLFYLWCAIPGWPHFVRRQPIRGHVFLWGFLLFLIAGLVLMGSNWGSIFIGLAFSVHSSAIADLVNQQTPNASVGERMLRGLAVSAALLAVYWPVGMLIGQVASPYQLEAPLPPFQTGDVVIASVPRHLRVGDVVLYELPDGGGAVVRREGMRQRILEGRNIDRILAGPGSVVEGRGGVLFVNGVPSREQPLNPVKFPQNWRQTVLSGQFLILPSDNADLLDIPANWGLLVFVPQESVVGRVYLRTQPWSRFSIIR